jgi:hypothetical protein
MNEHITLQAKYFSARPTFINLKKQADNSIVHCSQVRSCNCSQDTYLPNKCVYKTRHVYLSENYTPKDYWTGIAQKKKKHSLQTRPSGLSKAEPPQGRVELRIYVKWMDREHSLLYIYIEYSQSAISTKTTMSINRNNKYSIVHTIINTAVNPFSFLVTSCSMYYILIVAKNRTCRWHTCAETCHLS